MTVTERVPESVVASLDLIRDQRREGHLAEADRLCRQLLKTHPDLAEGWYQLGRILSQAGTPHIAAAMFGRAIALDSTVHKYHRWLGSAHIDRGQPAQAEASLRRAIEIEPESAEAHAGLGIAFQQRYQLTAAAACFEHAIEIDANHAGAHGGLGAVRCDQGRIEEGIGLLQRAVELQPDGAEMHSNLLFLLHYDVHCDRERLFAAARNWGTRHANPAVTLVESLGNQPDPLRKLRIGYVSGDFHSHPVGYFLEAVLQAHDKSQFEIYCYSNHWGADDLTRRVRNAADHALSIVGVSDDDVVNAVRRDGIDILVDLSGHTAGHRLGLFARKAAPVQASWIGYFDTTGVPAIDYLILDGALCPPGDEKYYTESVVRLPAGYVCYAPQVSPEVPVLPASTLGYVTFGCFNKVAKVNDGVVAVWARILLAIPNARLCLKSTSFEDVDVCEQYRSMFESHGVTSERLTLLGRSSYSEYLAEYGQVDIALDPFPFNGGTTTVEALWMGVPVVTLAGDHYVSRMGVSHLSSVGLTDLIASSPEEYIQTAIDLASDVPRLAELRANLRGLVKASPLCDGPSFTRGLEAAYREMWGAWCQTQCQVPGSAESKGR